MSVTEPPVDAPARPLELPTPLSQSIIWRLQRLWFEQEGARAWSTGTVPHMITSNAVVGGSYARVVTAFLREWRDRSPAPPTTPAYVIELGSGSGRLGYHFVSRLADRLDATPALADVPVTFVMTDLAASTIAGLRRHERLRPYVEAGRLDFAVVDAAAPGEVTLLESGAVLAPGSLSAPVVVMANYVLDSLPQDSYSVVGTDVVEDLASTHALPGATAEDLRSLDLFELRYTRRLVSAGPRYGDPEIDGLFWELSRPGGDRGLLFPIVALRCLRQLRSFTSEPFLLLSADKGFGDRPASLAADGPHLARHGCVSFMVDYTVLAADARRHGGVALLPRRPAHLTVGCFVYDRQGRAWPDVELAYADAVGRLGPDDFFTVNSLVERVADAASPAQLVAWLRSAEWDSAVFRVLYPRLVRRVVEMPEPDPEIRLALQEVERSYFPIGEEHDLPQQLATLHWHLGDQEECLRLLAWSVRLHGPSAERSLGRALALLARGDIDAAFGPAREAAAFPGAPAMAVELYRFLWERQDLPRPLVLSQWRAWMGARRPG